MKSLGIIVLLCVVALSVAQRGDFGNFVGTHDFPNNNNNFNPETPRPGRFGRPGRVTTTTLPPTPSNPGVDGAGALIGCNCPSTSETNVVCGSDGNNYGNMGKLRCAQRCGHGVQLAHLGSCQARGR